MLAKTQTKWESVSVGCVLKMKAIVGSLAGSEWAATMTIANVEFSLDYCPITLFSHVQCWKTLSR